MGDFDDWDEAEANERGNPGRPISSGAHARGDFLSEAASSFEAPAPGMAGPNAQSRPEWQAQRENWEVLVSASRITEIRIVEAGAADFTPCSPPAVEREGTQGGHGYHSRPVSAKYYQTRRAVTEFAGKQPAIQRYCAVFAAARRSLRILGRFAARSATKPFRKCLARRRGEGQCKNRNCQ